MRRDRSITLIIASKGQPLCVDRVTIWKRPDSASSQMKRSISVSVSTSAADMTQNATSPDNRLSSW